MLVAWWSLGLILTLGAGLLAARAVTVRLDRASSERDEARREARRLGGEVTRLSQRVAELGTTAGGLAHEIRNPLSTIRLNLQLLREDLTSLPGLPPRIVKRIDTVSVEASRLREILDDFLRYAGRMEVERRPTDLNRLLEELIDFLTPQAALGRVTIRPTLPVPSTIAEVDPKLIKQAVLNLLLNGIQAMPDGGTLSVDLLPGDEPTGERSFTIAVADTGPGVSRQDVDHIFTAYFTRKKGGTGLGLALTRRIAEEHGGTLTVHVPPGPGARFLLTLPHNSPTTGEAGTGSSAIDSHAAPDASR